MDQEFQLGDQVEWTSQANGSTVKKRGRVVFVNPNGMRVPGVFGDRLEVNAERIDMLVHNGWLEPGIAEDLKSRNFVRRCDHFGPVVVAVERFHKRTGERVKPVIYTPRVAGLILRKRGES